MICYRKSRPFPNFLNFSRTGVRKLTTNTRMKRKFTFRLVVKRKRYLFQNVLNPNPPPPQGFSQVARQLFGNFSYFEQFFSFKETSYSEQFLWLEGYFRYRSTFMWLNWPFFHISQCFIDNLWISCKKGAKSFPPPGADHRRKIKEAGLLGQRFLEKIQNGGRRFTLDLTSLGTRLTLDWLECLGWRRSFLNFIGSIHFLILIEGKVI